MSRPIKFRAYHKIKKIVFDVYSLSLEGAVPVVYAWHKSDTMPTAYDLKDIVLMQFTGLHDKNGKEIWQEDIVKAFDPALSANNSDTKPMLVVSVVEPCCGFMLQSSDFFRKVILLKDNEWMYEVIGNIYENSELLS